MLKKYQITESDVKILNNYCKRYKIKFLASCFDIKSLKLYSRLKNKSVKIPSGEITNLQLIEFAAKKFEKLIISTGMSNYFEIKKAVQTATKHGVKRKNITLLQCTTDYPATFKEANLKCMQEFKKRFKTEIGYSDHTEGDICSIVAATTGASIIEKHFTLNKKYKGPDHKASIDFKELAELNKKIKLVKVILGSKKKIITLSEIKNVKFVRKSLYAKKKINIGEIFTVDNVVAKRPLGGIPANELKKILGKKSKKLFRIDEKIQL